MIILKILFIQFGIGIAHHLTDLNLSVVESSIKAFQNKIKEDQQNEGKNYIF